MRQRSFIVSHRSPNNVRPVHIDGELTASSVARIREVQSEEVGVHPKLGLKVACSRLPPKDRNSRCMASENSMLHLLRRFLTDDSPFGSDHGLRCLFGYSVPMAEDKSTYNMCNAT